MSENYKDAYVDLKIEYDNAIKLIDYYANKVHELEEQNKEFANETKRLSHEVEWLENEINKLIMKGK